MEKMRREEEGKGILGRGLTTCKGMEVQNLGMSWELQTWLEKKAGCRMLHDLEPDHVEATMLSSV